MATASGFSEEDLTRYLTLTLDLYKALQYSLQPRLHLEVGLIKLVHAGRLQSIEEALAGLPLTASTRTAAPRPPAFQAPVLVAPPPPPPKPIAVAPPPPEEPESELVAPEAVVTGDFGEELYAALRKEGLNFSADAVQQAEVKLQGTELVLRANKMLSFALKDPGISRVASRLAGKPVRVRFEVGENAAAKPVAARKNDGEDAELRERALSHPGVKRFQELFPDAQVRTVRNLNE